MTLVGDGTLLQFDGEVTRQGTLPFVVGGGFEHGLEYGDSPSNHAMTLTGVNLDEQGKPNRWKVENSWGPNHGQGGCLIMTDRWFREYTFRLVVNKQYVPQDIMKQFEQKPIMVMPEDPLFSVDD